MYDRVKIDIDDDSDFLDELMAGVPWWKEYIYYPSYRFFRWHANPKKWFRPIKWFIQRGRRGYADCDVWNLSYYWSKTMAGSLRQLADESIGWPGPESQWVKFEDWKAALHKVADGLDHYVAQIDLNETCSCCGQYCKDIECPLIEETFRELYDLWPGLWD